VSHYCSDLTHHSLSARIGSDLLVIAAKWEGKLTPSYFTRFVNASDIESGLQDLLKNVKEALEAFQVTNAFGHIARGG
jgi:hypothetical protein